MEKYPTKRAYATGKLYKFLKEKGVYKQFVQNVKEQNKHLKGNKNHNDFFGAFTWNNTKEGYDFWIELYKEFDEQTRTSN